MRYQRALAVLFVTAAMVLSGCGAEKDSDAADTPPFNQADVTFVRGMIPHHRQAIQMAQLAQSRAADLQVKQLAQRIEAAQGPEIATMLGWLRAWNRPLGAGIGGSGGMDHGGSGGMDHGGSDGMSGMMGARDMQELRSAKGAAFDEAFLTMMIEHHKGAIDMASTQEQQGRNREALALAEQIQQDQAAEIEHMVGLLDG